MRQRQTQVLSILLFTVSFPWGVAADVFTRDLFFGLRNDAEVVKLQDFLREQELFDFHESTGNFYTLTLEAVKKFQKAHRIQPVEGYFGPISRKKAHEIIAARVSRPPPAATSTPESLSSATSTYNKKIVLSKVSGKSSDPLDETTVIVNKDKTQVIDVTGWTIENTQGHRFSIPLVYALPGFTYRPVDRLRLLPGGKVTITVGKQERGMDFQENICTRYFRQTSKFKPDLSGACPRLDTRNLIGQFSDRCIKALEKIPACIAPASSSFAGLDSECTNFIVQNYSYAGCVKNFRSRQDFFGQDWLIWMQQDQEFFRNTHDVVTLKDYLGKVVDVKSY